MVSLIVSPLTGMKITSLISGLVLRLKLTSFMLLATAIAMELFILVTDGDRFDTNSLCFFNSSINTQSFSHALCN